MTQHMEANTYTHAGHGMTADELRAWAKTEIGRVENDLAKISDCRYCESFRRDSSHCERWGAAVPQEHQASGCADWRIDLIPF